MSNAENLIKLITYSNLYVKLCEDLSNNMDKLGETISNKSLLDISRCAECMDECGVLNSMQEHVESAVKMNDSIKRYLSEVSGETITNIHNKSEILNLIKEAKENGDAD